MVRKYFKLAGVFLLLLFFTLIYSEQIPNKEQFLKQIFKDYKIEPIKNINDFYIVKNKKHTYYAVFSDSYSKAKGYEGPISILMVLSRDLKTLKFIKIYRHSETPYFMERVIKEHFLDKFKNILVKTLIKQQKIDTVTGCTFTSNGIFETVKETLSKITTNKILKKKFHIKK